MNRRAPALRLSLLLLLGAASPAWAGAPDESRARLGEEIAQACVAAPGGGGTIAPKALANAIFASGYVSLRMQYDWIGAGGAAIAEAARTARSTSPGAAGAPVDPDNKEGLGKLFRLVWGWSKAGSADVVFGSMPDAVRHLSVLRPDRSAWPQDAWPEALAAILDGADDALLITCRPAAPIVASGEGPPAVDTRRPRTGSRPDLIVARNPTDLTIAELADRQSAEVALIADRIAGETSIAVNGTIGLRWGDVRIGRPAASLDESSVFARLRPMAFVQLERQSITGDTFAIDNLSAGFQIDGFVQSRRAAPRADRHMRRRLTHSHYFALNGRYLTDTRFLSRSWSLAARVTPDLDIEGYGNPFTVAGLVRFKWLASITFDHVSNDRPGQKAELVDAPSWTRIGYDLAATIAPRSDTFPSMEFKMDYAARHVLSAGAGRAEMLSLRWQYRPSLGLSFGLAWDRGENIDSLVRASVVKAVLGFRN